MNETDEGLRVAFEALAMRPHEGGVRMPEDLAIWLLEEYRRLQQPAPLMIQKVLRTVSQVLEARPPPCRRRLEGRAALHHGRP